MRSRAAAASAPERLLCRHVPALAGFAARLSGQAVRSRAKRVKVTKVIHDIASLRWVGGTKLRRQSPSPMDPAPLGTPPSQGESREVRGERREEREVVGDGKGRWD